MEKENQVVNDPLTEGQPSEGDLPIEEGKPVGSDTDSALLLKSLQEEREKRRIAQEQMKALEEELTNIKSSTTSDQEIFSDEGKLLQNQIKALEKVVLSSNSALVKQELLSAHPILKEKWFDFEDFCSKPENKGMSMTTAAKAYLIENELVSAPIRRGLEKPTGGNKIPPKSDKMTSEEIKTLRTTNYRKYQDMIRKGQIKLED